MRIKAGLPIAAGLLIMTVLTGCLNSTMIDPAPPPPPRKKLVGTWLAFSSFRAYRLELFADGTGALATGHQLDPGVVRRYTTDRWQLDGHNLSATFIPIDAELQRVFVRATAEDSGSVYLRNVSMSLSDDAFVPVADEFTNESRVKEWLYLFSVE